MKRLFSTCLWLSLGVSAMAQGWPANYNGVMLQGFFWDSFDESQWTRLTKQADDFSGYFDLVWVPQSGKCLNSSSMGYDPYYYFNQNSSFGTADELKTMISTFKQKNILTIADVVINHRNTTGWFTFPAETWNGQTYQMLPTDIVANDDNGAAKTEADKEGVTLSANNDEGEGWPGMRDLDHKSQNVQNIIKAYESFLVNEMGYAGFRYDMVKGFSGSHVGDYNEAAGVNYSVGEYWDNNSKIKSWIDATGKRSAAFDFQFHYAVTNAINTSNWGSLSTASPLIKESNYKRYAVTFVENHDLEQREGTSPDPIKKDTLAANAYLLAMPGTPCVFLKHYLAYPDEIKAMIDARKAAGITNQSNSNDFRTTTSYYGVITTGTKGQLLAIVGNTALMGEPSSSYSKILSGYHYAYYLSKSAETAFIDKPSGTYSKAFSTTLTAVSNSADAKIAYTTDGTEPSATNGTQVASGTTVSISSDCTLKAVLIAGGAAKGSVITRHYMFSHFTPKDIYVYVNADDAGSAWSNWKDGIYYWTWGGDGTHAPKSGKWPGDKVAATETAYNKQWAVQSYTLSSEDDAVSFVFNMGSNVTQTENKTGVNKTTYLLINNTTDDSGHNTISTVATGIKGITNVEKPTDDKWYTLNGQRIERPTQRGIYIHNGKKLIIH